MIKYPKTRQFRDIIRDVAHRARYKGLDENNQPIYSNEDLPTLRFTGTVKLHGTNAGITWNLEEGLKCQSRNRVVSDGHFGFPEMIEREEETVNLLLRDAIEMAINRVGFDVTKDTISIFGEWAGPGIQNGVAISEIPEKTWFIFGIKVNKSDNVGIWIDIVDKLKSRCSPIRLITDYKIYEVDIDFNYPTLSQNNLVEVTQEIEKQCPVAKAFEIEGVGEGAVWTCFWGTERLIFKTKGDKHSVSKVKTIAPVDAEKVQNISEFIENSVTLNRVKQGMQEVCDMKEISFTDLSRSHTGDILRWVVNDILVEEKDIMHASGLEKKDVSKEISHKSRGIFFDILDTIL